jgi:SAM-dependent methyltransferase
MSGVSGHRWGAKPREMSRRVAEEHTRMLAHPTGIKNRKALTSFGSFRVYTGSCQSFSPPSHYLDTFSHSVFFCSNYNMATQLSGNIIKLYDQLGQGYEDAYKDNPLKHKITTSAISLLRGSEPHKVPIRILDVGCGTGIPVSKLLADEGFEVHGFDISPEMVQLANSNVSGTFEQNNMVDFQPQRSYDAVFIIFSQLELSYAQLHAAVWKIVHALKPNGLLVIGQTPADNYVADDGQSNNNNNNKGYHQDCPIPFFGNPHPTLAMTARGQRDFLTSMGLVILDEIDGVFQPNNPACDKEYQQYIIAQLPEGVTLAEPEPKPE